MNATIDLASIFGSREPEAMNTGLTAVHNALAPTPADEREASLAAQQDEQRRDTDTPRAYAH